MKTLPCSIALLSLGIVLSAGKCTKTSSADALEQMAGDTWQLSQLDGSPVSVPEGRELPHLKVDPTNNALSGFGGCNRLMGSVQLEGDRLSFPGLAGTKMYCQETMALEDKFTAALRDTDSYKLDGGKLTLLKGTRELATLVRTK